MPFTGEEIALIVAGARLVYALYQNIDKALLEQALSRKVVLPPVTRVLSWADTEAFINANPAFLDTGSRSVWWDNRADVQCRVRLMVDLGHDVSRSQLKDVYLFAPEIVGRADVLHAVVSVAERIQEVLQNAALSRSQKVEQVTRIIEEVSK
jgi:hypothetical protein